MLSSPHLMSYAHPSYPSSACGCSFRHHQCYCSPLPLESPVPATPTLLVACSFAEGCGARASLCRQTYTLCSPHVLWATRRSQRVGGFGCQHVRPQRNSFRYRLGWERGRKSRAWHGDFLPPSHPYLAP